MQYRWLGCLTLASLVAVGCSEKQEVLVAEVGPHQINAGSLRAFVEKLLPGQRTRKTGDAGRRHYLQILVDGRLLLLEARERGLDTSKVVRKAVEDAVDKQVLALYQKEVISPVAKVSEEEMRHYFAEERFDRERLFSGILVETRAQIDKVVEELQAGRPFEEVARDYSLDERSAAKGGELGFVGRTMIAQLNIPPDVFRSLPLGEVTSPLPAGGQAWHVFRFTEERPASFSKYRLFIQRQLNQEREFQAEREHLEMLKESFQARLNPAGLQEVMQAYRQRQPTALTRSSTPLYTHDGGEISVAEGFEALRALNLRGAFADSAGAVFMLYSAVLRPFLLERAARETGLYDRPEIRRSQERKQEDILVEHLKKVAVTQQIEVSEEEIREYYENNPRTFRIEKSTRIEEVLLATEEEARQAREQIFGGASFAQLAERSLRGDAQRNKAQYHFHDLDKITYPTLVAAVMEAPVGELIGPLKVAGGYSVFRVLGRESESIQSYEKARKQARSLALRKRRAQALEKLVKALREKYKTQVKIYDARLTRALPDSLLQG